MDYSTPMSSPKDIVFSFQDGGWRGGIAVVIATVGKDRGRVRVGG